MCWPFGKAAQAAWECADPGIQYDNTINDWHTCPESRRITPCSEYVRLDNSSCNLASIDLLKFLRDDDTFDAGRFAHMSELIITAMDISVRFADFPTAKIAETTRAYRELDIGYANLGALLLATGHAYLVPLLAERGVHLPREQVVFRLVTQPRNGAIRAPLVASDATMPGFRNVQAIGARHRVNK
jgi:Ribonucleotide reductase, barrel domain